MKNELTEIKLRYSSHKEVVGAKIESTKDAERILRQIYDEEQLEAFESFYALYLDDEMNCIAYLKVSSGGLTATVVDVKHILVGLIKVGATKLIVSHNHPSGNLNPSDSDKKITEKIKNACEVLDYKLIDHLILNTKDYYSFLDEGLLEL